MPQPWQTATLYLSALRRQAHASARLHLIETTAIAILFGSLSATKLTSWNELALPTLSAALFPALLAGALWLGAGTALYYYARESHQRYIEWLLTESGLLYLLLEHDPHEALPALNKHASLRKLALLESPALSFRARINHLLATYPRCARGIGQVPYTGPWRAAELFVGWATLPAGLLFAGLVYHGILLALSGTAAFPPEYKAAFTLLIVLIFTRATLQVARTTALRLALTQILVGDAEPGQATLARHP